MLGGCILLVAQDNYPARSSVEGSNVQYWTCLLPDTLTEGVIEGPGGSVIDEAPLIPRWARLRLGWLPDRTAHRVRGTNKCPDSEHQSAPGLVDGSALFVRIAR